MFFKKRDKSPPFFSSGASAAIPTIVSANMKVKGDFDTPGVLEIDGSVEGNIRCHTLSVRKGGTLHGNVAAQEVHLDGAADGMIKGKNVYVANGAAVGGILYYENLTVRDGATVNAQCRNLSELNAKPAASSSEDEMFEELTLSESGPEDASNEIDAFAYDETEQDDDDDNDNDDTDKEADSKKDKDKDKTIDKTEAEPKPKTSSGKEDGRISDVEAASDFGDFDLTERRSEAESAKDQPTNEK